MSGAGDGLLDVENLKVTYAGGAQAVRGMSFTIMPGECIALVGESGCGKTTVARAVLGLLPKSARVTGSIRFAGRELTRLPEREMRQIRGREIGLVWQDPFDTLNPLHTVESHVRDAWRVHGDRVLRQTVGDRLAALGIPDTARTMRRYPHEWSGGMLQRAAIVAAAAHHPPFIVADEPTSALDAERAEAILAALRATGAAILLVSHDLGLVARHADRIAVCYAGRIVEIGPSGEISARARHPYTVGLQAASPRLGMGLPQPLAGSPPSPFVEADGCAFAPRCALRAPSCAREEPQLVDGLACPVAAAGKAARAAPAAGRSRVAASGAGLLAAERLSKVYGRGTAAVTAVAQATLALRRGEIVGISGPSGSGKSTLLRLLAMIERPSSGAIEIGEAATGRSRSFAMAIFQDARGSLDARWPVWRSITEPLTVRGRALPAAQRRSIASDRLADVGLAHIDREARPGELSVGQCQRVAIARALVADPALLVADEPTSALDPPVAASILALLAQMSAGGTAIVVVSHDRAMLSAVCDRVMSMREGVLQ